MDYINLKPDHSKPQVFFSNILPHAKRTQALGSLTRDPFSWNNWKFEKTRSDIQDNLRKVILDRYIGHSLGLPFWMSLWSADFMEHHFGHFLVTPS